jgi:hypothetical protein
MLATLMDLKDAMPRVGRYIYETDAEHRKHNLFEELDPEFQQKIVYLTKGAICIIS